MGIESVRRERKSYRNKCEHFKKETKGFAAKYEDLNVKYVELEQQLSIYQKMDDRISEDGERRMNVLEANNDALNEQLAAARHEIEELNLLRDNLSANQSDAQKEIMALTHKLQNKEHQILSIKQDQEAVHNNLNQFKASKALMETMWNEFKKNQTQQNESLLNHLENKISTMGQQEIHKYHSQIKEYQKEIGTLEQQLSAQKTNQNQNKQITVLQQENDALINQISGLKLQLAAVQNFGDEHRQQNPEQYQSNDSSLMMIQNHDTLKQRSMELKKENMRLRKELNQTKRLLENNGWERTLHEQNLK